MTRPWVHAIADGRVVGIEVLSPAAHLDDLESAAAGRGLDGQAVRSAAVAALASPDRRVEITVAAAA